MFVSFQTWSYGAQEDELRKRAPYFLRSLKAAAINPRSIEGTNKYKDYAAIVPGIMSAAGTLLQCRNKHMAAHATITGLQLKSGGATKQTHNRLHARSMSVSYTTVLEKQVMLGVGFDKEVRRWKEEMEADTSKIRNLKEQISSLEDIVNKEEHDFRQFLELKNLKAQLETATLEQHPGFQLVGDNIDFSVNPRQFTTEKGRTSLHYFNFLAIKNRVSNRKLWLCMHVCVCVWGGRGWGYTVGIMWGVQYL